MPDRAYDKRFFAEWLKEARRNLRLDEEKFADMLGISVGTLLLWEVGNTPWVTIPLEDKRKIQKICGRFPQDRSPFVLSEQVYRQIPGSSPQEDMAPQIAQGFIEVRCARCGSPILIKHEGRCPMCDQAVDGGL